MTQAKPGDTVQIHYTGRFEDGEVFDSSQGREPLAFRLGEGQVIPGFEQAIVEMAVGETKTAKIPADEAYGPPRPELVFKFPRERLPEGIDPQVGEVLEMRDQAGQAARVRVVDVAEDAVTMDANHPLAGRDLVFDIQLVAIG